MIGSVLRSLLAIVLALFVAMVWISLVEVVTLSLHPFPEGADLSDHKVVEDHVANFPAWGLAIALVGWSAAAFCGAWVATRLGAGRHRAHGIAVGALLLAAAGYNMYLLPYPMWFEVLTPLILPIATLLAVRLAAAPKEEAAEKAAA